MASLTSCTLNILAPLINATIFRAVVPFSASAGVISRVFQIIPFLDTPATIGSPKIFNKSNLANSSKLCSKVLPKPKPGSIKMSVIAAFQLKKKKKKKKSIISFSRLS